MRYLIKFSYDGSKFNGFQRLNDGSGVQNYIENALSTINKKIVLLKGAGRTDRGVHATNQAAHFDLDVFVPADRLINAINSLVGNYIHINSCELVESDFHARHSVKEKKYIYKIYTGEIKSYLYDYYQFYNDLDISKLDETLKLFEGGHCFKNFVSGERDNYNAIINKCFINKYEDFIELVFIGKSFYRYMIRNLVGAAVGVSRGKYDINYVKSILNCENDIQLTTEIPNGLYLEDVYY